MVEISTTSVNLPNAVKSTATTVSQGVRAFAKPSRIVRSTPNTSCSSSSEVILIKRPKASEAVPNHQEVFMARAENLAGLGCMPYLPHTGSTSKLRKYRGPSPHSEERPTPATVIIACAVSLSTYPQRCASLASVVYPYLMQCSY